MTAHARSRRWTELDYADRAKDEMLKALPVGEATSELPHLMHSMLRQSCDCKSEFSGAIKAYGELVRLITDDPRFT